MATVSLQSTPTVPSNDSYIGSSVSLISKSKIQYEGVLFHINSLNSTISLKNGPQLICGLKIYGVIPTELTTHVEQVVVMKALKESLHVLDHMGWNGHPCSLISWDPWVGVTCQPDKNRIALVVSAMDLSNNQFSGSIPDSLAFSNLQLL